MANSESARVSGERLDNALLKTPISNGDIAFHSAYWTKCLAGEDDSDWNWHVFVVEYANEISFSLWHDDHLQGLMIVVKKYRCQSIENGPIGGCYVAYLATAPWNRPDVRQRGLCISYKECRGVGTRLIGEAIQLSLKLGYNGLIAWHSKARAVAAYQRLFERACGAAPILVKYDASEDGLPLFEITAEMAREFGRSN